MSLREYTSDIARSVAFLSRISVPSSFFEGYDGRLDRASRAFPFAGLLIALPAAIVFGVLLASRADPLMAALLALAVQTMTTGALHEDGLSDTADGIGGGRDRDRALSIMKDSRIGTYGAVALVLSFGLRAAALAAIARGLPPFSAALALPAAATLSRGAMVWHWYALPPAKPDGIAASAGRPDYGA
ncbi:MAG: adenosylcobinamide-GDP ribazoletransferase, partial [Rhizobiaceae bacterium]|nr:adenosylcobinamide-GDP ribazoletransferase [Rhizobiaceae bacterium]